MSPTCWTAKRLTAVLVVTVLLAACLTQQKSRHSANIGSRPRPAPLAKPTIPERGNRVREILQVHDAATRRQALEALLERLDPREFADVARVLAGVPDDQDIDLELALLAKYWAKFDGAACLDFLTRIQPRQSGLAIPVQAAMREWTAREPDSATRYVAALPLETSAWRSTVISGTAMGLAAHDPAYALSWAMKPDPERHRVIVAVTNALVGDDSAGIAGWISAHAALGLDIRDAALETAKVYARTAPAEALTWVLGDLPAGETQQWAFAAAIRPLAAANPETAAALLQSRLFAQLLATVPDAARANYYQTILGSFVDGASYSAKPEVALANLPLIADEETRTHLRSGYYAAVDAAGQRNPWIGGTPVTAAPIRTFDLGAGIPPSSADGPALPMPPAPLLQATATDGTAVPGPALPRQDSDGVCHYLVESSSAVRLTLASGERDPGAAVVSTYAHESVSTTITAHGVTFVASPGQRVIVDFGGGRRATIIVTPPSA